MWARNAFAHKGGMHVAGVNRDARTFEHIDPAEVGADRRVLISELSGKGTVQARAERPCDGADARRGWSSASRSSSTGATSSRPPTARSTS